MWTCMCGLVRKGTWKKRGSVIVEGEYEEKWRCLESLGGKNHFVFHNVEIYGG